MRLTASVMIDEWNEHAFFAGGPEPKLSAGPRLEFCDGRWVVVVTHMSLESRRFKHEEAGRSLMSMNMSSGVVYKGGHLISF